MKKSLCLIILLSFIILSSNTIFAATTITPKYSDLSFSYSKEYSKASTVHLGDYLINIKNANKGILLFVPDESTTYVFTFSALKSSKYCSGDVVLLEADDDDNELDILDVKTQGGTADYLDIATKDDDPEEEIPEELYLKTRTATIKLTKGRAVFINYDFPGGDSFRVSIKKSGSNTSSKVKEPDYTKVKLNAFGTYSKYDITGDGYADKIEFSHDRFDGYSYQKVSIKVNGKTVLTKKSSYHYENMGAYLLKIGGKKYLFLYSIGEHEEGDILGFFRYSGGKLVEEVNLIKAMKSIKTLWMRGFSISNGKIYLKVEGVSKIFDRVFLKPCVEYKGGKLVLSSSIIPFVKESGYNGHLCNGQYFTTTRNITGYKSYSGSTTAFTITKGTKIKFINFYPGNPARLYVKTDTGKTCWIKDSGTKCISGTYYWA